MPTDLFKPLRHQVFVPGSLIGHQQPGLSVRGMGSCVRQDNRVITFLATVSLQVPTMYIIHPHLNDITQKPASSMRGVKCEDNASRSIPRSATRPQLKVLQLSPSHWSTMSLARLKLVSQVQLAGVNNPFQSGV